MKVGLLMIVETYSSSFEEKEFNEMRKRFILKQGLGKLRETKIYNKAKK